MSNLIVVSELKGLVVTLGSVHVLEDFVATLDLTICAGGFCACPVSGMCALEKQEQEGLVDLEELGLLPGLELLLTLLAPVEGFAVEGQLF